MILYADPLLGLELEIPCLVSYEFAMEELRHSR